MKHFDDINDDEIRIIGNDKRPMTPPRKPFWRQWWFWTAIAGTFLLLALSLLLTYRSSIRHSQIGTVEMLECDFESSCRSVDAVSPTIVECEPATVLVRDTVVNDVPLRLRTPVNALPELVVGIPDIHDESLILAYQAADIRADNQEIVGAFVLKGELLARGVSKRGYCAILNWKIQLGMAESTPLFEEATDKDGYFFRQYPLVSGGKMVENKPKGKALRHALCELDDHIVVISSGDEESFHDFAQALEDLGVQNAVNLVGKDAYGFCHNNDTGFQSWGELTQDWKRSPYLNFIVWRVPE